MGGGYGVAVGGAFAIESQFARESHTSKVGFAVLNWHLARWGFVLNDNKLPARNCLDMGFRVVPRAEFLARLREAQRAPDKVGAWEVETDLPTVATWQPGGAPMEADETTSVESPAVMKPHNRVWVPLLPAVNSATIGLTESMIAFI